MISTIVMTAMMAASAAEKGMMVSSRTAAHATAAGEEIAPTSVMGGGPMMMTSLLPVMRGVPPRPAAAGPAEAQIPAAPGAPGKRGEHHDFAERGLVIRDQHVLVAKKVLHQEGKDRVF